MGVPVLTKVIFRVWPLVLPAGMISTGLLAPGGGAGLASVEILRIHRDRHLGMADYLGYSGHDVRICKSREIVATDRLFAAIDVAVVLCDGVSPRSLGSVTRIRAKGNAGIILFPALRSLNFKILGLEAGADVVLDPEAELRGLEAQIRALTRRARLSAGFEGTSVSRSMPTEWVFDSLSQVLIAPNGSAMQLTASESVIVGSLASCPSQVVLRLSLLGSLGKRFTADAALALSSMIARIRTRGRGVFGLDVPIQSVNGRGYAFLAAVGCRREGYSEIAQRVEHRREGGEPLGDGVCVRKRTQDGGQGVRALGVAGWSAEGAFICAADGVVGSSFVRSGGDAIAL